MIHVDLDDDETELITTPKITCDIPIEPHHIASLSLLTEKSRILYVCKKLVGGNQITQFTRFITTLLSQFPHKRSTITSYIQFQPLVIAELWSLVSENILFQKISQGDYFTTHIKGI